MHIVKIKMKLLVFLGQGHQFLDRRIIPVHGINPIGHVPDTFLRVPVLFDLLFQHLQVIVSNHFNGDTPGLQLFGRILDTPMNLMVQDDHVIIVHDIGDYAQMPKCTVLGNNNGMPIHFLNGCLQFLIKGIGDIGF